MLPDDQGNVLAENVVLFRNAWTQGWGLRLREPQPGTAYLFAFGREVQLKYSMWFVFWPIDVHFLDKEKHIIESKYRFEPFQTYAPTKQYWYAIEFRTPGPRLRRGEKLRF